MKIFFFFADFSPKFIRTKRSYLQLVGNTSSSSQNSISSLSGMNHNDMQLDNQYLEEKKMVTVKFCLTFVVQPFDRRCRVLPNDTVSCDRVLYQDPVEWKNHKEKLDEMIEEYRKMLEDLRVWIT